VAIDGPAGAGKTTVARIVAAKLGYLYVDTGAMYRAVTLRVLRTGAPLVRDSLQPLVSSLDLRLLDGHRGSGEPRVLLDGEDVSQAIRCAAVTGWVSAVSADPAVRRAMVGLQRALAGAGGVVMEGRDIGTVVLPEAGTKVFLTAARRERARRRAKELARQGRPASVLQQYLAIRRRDRLDMSRPDSPLRTAADATIVDTTLLGPEEVAACVLALHSLGRKGEPRR
jgi:cytidylate kinase